MGEYFAGISQQHLAGRSQLDAAAIASQQRSADLRFEAPESLTQGGLREWEVFGRAAEAQPLGNCNEVTKVAALSHPAMLSVSRSSQLTRPVALRLSASTAPRTRSRRASIASSLPQLGPRVLPRGLPRGQTGSATTNKPVLLPTNAAAAAANKETMPMPPTAGQLVTETLEYDGGRQVTAYVPSAAPEAIVFAGDGQLIAPWGGVLEAAELTPTTIIGAHRSNDETVRVREYSPGESTATFAFDPERFAAHEKFFVEDVRRWAQSRFDVALPADRTAVFGVSASGELALAMGLRHPDTYGAVFCASPGAGYQPPAAMPSSLPRAYLVAGMQEPFFLENATRWADALRDAGADVVMTERAGSHGDAFWREEFPLMVAWAFGR
jgi:predicted esterase